MQRYSEPCSSWWAELRMLLMSYSKQSCSSWFEAGDTKAELFFWGSKLGRREGPGCSQVGGIPQHKIRNLCLHVFPLQKGFDVFNALDLMENKTFLEKLKFGIGDGNLQYYLYNWKCPSMAPEKVSAVRRGLIPTAPGT